MGRSSLLRTSLDEQHLFTRVKERLNASDGLIRLASGLFEMMAGYRSRRASLGVGGTIQCRYLSILLHLRRNRDAELALRS